ncbi:hypothetical protein GXW83_18955 [Streptacidiphilus sp. PB12-B1b]|uniref:hypothetical protein n=1 Tax=Streptacidiphilus sp. PB12-B1b TaxID=2705012 RepID=UPI0015FE3B01|nr:hypothetical protein [Streptacidiphilus sp. PB12-B1b]QMU77467.1 hypothetical protein GXW83_18955 [Streptacidiphilus sp. PB12-B1b]
MRESAVDRNGDLKPWALPNPAGDRHQPGWILNDDADWPIIPPEERRYCANPACEGQELMHFPQCWTCPYCLGRVPIRRALTL